MIVQATQLSFVYENESRFEVGENISLKTSGIFATVTAVTPGDRNILKNFDLDNGQRDSFYDIGSIVRKPGALAPTGRLLITFSFFSHGAGDYFSVDSYSGAVDYDAIPSFDSPSKGKLELKYLALAHFGIHDKPYLLIENAKESIEVWIKFVTNLPNLSDDEAAKVLTEWLVSNYKFLGIDENTIENYINNSHFEMQIQGIRNYLTK